MGFCTSIPVKPVSTELEQGNVKVISNAISFKIPDNQPTPDLISGVDLIIVKPFYIYNHSIGQPYSGRQVTIDLTRIVADHQNQFETPIEKDTKIQFRLAFVYPKYKCRPSKVFEIVYNPGSKIQRGLRLSQKKVKQINKELIQKTRKFSHPSIKYYKQSVAYANVVLLGSANSGKSSYLRELSKLVCEQPLHLHISNHGNLQVSRNDSFEKYTIVKSSSTNVTVIDSPGFKSIDQERIVSILRGKMNSTQEFHQNIVHSSIVFINVKDNTSMENAQTYIKLLIKENVPYVVVLTNIEKQGETFQEFYLKQANKKFEQKVKQCTKLSLIQTRTFPISNNKCEQGNKYAMFSMLSSFLEALNLAGTFYFNNPPLYILLDDKILDIKFRIKNPNMSLDELVSFLLLDSMLAEAGTDIKKVFIEATYGKRNQQKRGVIKISKQMNRISRNLLENYVTTIDKRFRAINLYTKAPLFATQIV